MGRKNRLSPVPSPKADDEEQEAVDAKQDTGPEPAPKDGDDGDPPGYWARENDLEDLLDAEGVHAKALGDLGRLLAPLLVHPQVATAANEIRIAGGVREKALRRLFRRANVPESKWKTAQLDPGTGKITVP
ncbi:MAG: hypothetical protein Q8R92_21155 [Deltaproteobacteria bacterium]|nr:hypothetical protein [Deltaproteobacteria bacterium]